MANPKTNNPNTSGDNRSSKDNSASNVETKKADSNQNESTEKSEQAGFSGQSSPGSDKWRTVVDDDGVTAGNPKVLRYHQIHVSELMMNPFTHM